MLNFKSAALPGVPMVDYVGTQGTGENGLNNGAYEYRVLATLGYSMDNWSLGVQWQHLPSIEDSTEASFPTPTTGYPSYNIFHLNGTYSVTDNVNLRFGVENLFDKAPPIGVVNTANTQPSVDGNLPGGQFDSLFYDTNGRRFYLGANFKF
jgi:outer membrane receptor for ferrienterochelin and colicin